MPRSASTTPKPPSDAPHRRAIAVAVLFTLLVVAGIALLVLAPPGGSEGNTAPRRAASAEVSALSATPDTALPSSPAPGAVELTYAGDTAAPVEGLSYRFDIDDDAAPRFSLTLEQRMEASEAGGERSVVITRLDAVLELELSRDKRGLAFARVVEFDVEVEADGKAVELPAVSSLLRGIRVEVTLDPTQGLGHDEPIAATNPQVKRMITLMVDALRQAHPTLPSDTVGVGARWTAHSAWTQEGGSGLTASVVRHHTLEAAVGDDGALPVTMQLELAMDGATVRGVGQGQLLARIDPASGRLLESVGELTYEQDILGKSARESVAKQSRTLGWTIRAAD